MSSLMRILVFFFVFKTISALPFGLRVVNGTRANLGEFPFMVSIRIAGSGSHICGGTILNPMWILTAAHCVFGSRPDSLNIQYGVTTISRKGPNIANISAIEVYEGYFLPAILHDIALVRMTEPLMLSSSVRAILLPRMYQLTPEDSTVSLIGWGLNESKGTIQKDLQKVELKIYSRADCSERHLLRVHPTNICAGVEGGGKGQCNGDSGGPLIYNGKQVGITSWSMKPCAMPPYPGVYTEVSNYIDWIKFVMEYYDDE